MDDDRQMTMAVCYHSNKYIKNEFECDVEWRNMDRIINATE